MTTDPPTERPGPLASSWVQVPPAGVVEALGTFASLAAAIGQRLAELHAAFSQAGTAPPRDGATFGPDDLDRLAERAKTAWERGRAAMTSQPSPSDAAKATVDQLIANHDRFLAGAAGVARRRSTRPCREQGSRHARPRARAHLRRRRPVHRSRRKSDRATGVETTTRDAARRRGQPVVVAPECRHASARRPSGDVTDRSGPAGRVVTMVGGRLRARARSRPTDGRRSAWHSSRTTPTTIATILRLLLFERAFGDISRSAVASPEWLETAAAGALALVEPVS